MLSAADLINLTGSMSYPVALSFCMLLRIFIISSKATLSKQNVEFRAKGI